MYEYYVFDLYGTLVDIHTEESGNSLWKKLSLFYRFYKADYSASELKDAYFNAVNAGLKSKKTALDINYSHESYPELQIEDIFMRLFNDKGVNASMELAVHAGQIFRIESMRHLKLYPGVKKFLTAIKKAGKKVYLLSNAQRIFTEYEMNALGITDLFDGILISSDKGTRKPDKRFFMQLKEQFNIDFSKSLMIGNDSRCDIEGAKNVGMHTLYVRSNISPQNDPVPDADYVFDKMDIYAIGRTLGFKL